MPNENILAVIDIGTNTTRVLVKDINSPEVDLSRKVEITRLGSEIEKTGRLGLQGMDDTKKAVLDFIEVAKKLGATESGIRIFATAGSRNSENGDEFISALEKQSRCKALIISGEEEGKRAFSGAISGVSGPLSPSVVFDIGGGSTEFAISQKSNPEKCDQVISIPIGSVRITKRHLESDPPKPEELTNAIADIREHLKDVEAQIPHVRTVKNWIGVAATVTTTAAVEIGMQEFDASKIHEIVLTKEMVEEVFRTLATESLEDRIFNPGLEKQRADVIVGGVAIIVSIMRHFELASIKVSCTDLLDGLWLGVKDGEL